MSWSNATKILTLTTLLGNTGIVITDGGSPSHNVALSVTSNAGQLGTTSNDRLEFYTNSAAAQMTLSTSGQLRIGSSTPSYQLDVAGDGYFTSRMILNASSAAVSPSGTGAFRFNTGTSHLEFSENGGSWTQIGTASAGMSIGASVTSGTSKSILYVDGSNNLAQDNANLAWDFTNHRLGIGTNIPTAQFHNIQIAQTSGSPNMFLQQGGAHTTLAINNEAIDGYFKLDRTVQFTGSGSAGAANITTQRAIYISAPTYSFSNSTAQTITNAATLAISAAPSAGANATITNAYSVWAQAGIAAFDGHIKVDGYTIDISGGASNNQALVYSGAPTNKFIAQTVSLVGTSGQKFYTIIPAAYYASNGTTTVLTVGAFRYDPTNYTLSGTTQSIVFRAVAANGSTSVTGHVRLRDITNGVDITTFSITAGTTTASVFEQTLTTAAVPAANIIFNGAAIYEIRIYVDSPASSSDFIQLYSSEIRNIQTIN